MYGTDARTDRQSDRQIEIRHGADIFIYLFIITPDGSQT